MKKQNIKSFGEAVRYMNETPRFTVKNTMEDTKAFLHRLGDPDRKMKIIHVAGTNGKGSVCAYIRSVLEEAGYRVASFTSPHLVDIRERFVVDGQMISEEEFLSAFLTIYHMLDWDCVEAEGAGGFYHPSYFEFLFFIAMIFFAGKKPDYCILETGLGGRLDATNSVSGKELAVITHIGLDHVEYLGDTVSLIAGEKAGIMQAGAPALYWSTSQETDAVFEAKAAELGIKADSVSKSDYQFQSFQNKTIDFSVHTRYYNDISLTLHTIAGYQMENCTLAIRAIELLDKEHKLTKEQIQRGIAECFWAGRMEEVLPEVFVDGAHNEDGIRAFLEAVKADGHRGTRTLCFSVVKDKDSKSMVERLVTSGLFDRIAIVPMHTERTVPPEVLRDLFDRYEGCRYTIYENVATAFRKLLRDRVEEERIYIAGSLYLVGEIKELIRDDKF